MKTRYPDHILLSFKDDGVCRTLTGEVEVLAVFVDTPGAVWTEQGMTKMLKELRRAMLTLRQDADRYGAALQMRLSCFTSRAGRQLGLQAADRDAWIAESIRNVRRKPDADSNLFLTLAAQRECPALPSFDVGGTYFAGKPLLFLQCFEDRAFAVPRYDRRPETAFVFGNHTAGMIRHELLHVFGAADFYQLRALKKRINADFGGSVMITAADDAPVDSVTAYLVGWAPVPDAAVQAFFGDTAHLTWEDVRREEAEETLTGFGRKEYTYGVYMGMLKNGVPEGIGRLEWSDGRACTGSFAAGSVTGKACMTFPDGGSYTGEMEDYLPKGHGTRLWPDGTLDTGLFDGWKLSGPGTRVWGEKSVHAGQCYTGSFENDQCHGWGMMCYADGTVQTGWWENNRYLGEKKPGNE